MTSHPVGGPNVQPGHRRSRHSRAWRSPAYRLIPRRGPGRAASGAATRGPANMASGRTREGLDRVIAVTDAVVAISVTLLVLPLVDIASTAGADASVGQLLHAHSGEIFSFLLSFAVIIRLWLVHHRLVEYVANYDQLFVLVTLVWILTIEAMVPRFDHRADRRAREPAGGRRALHRRPHGELGMRVGRHGPCHKVAHAPRRDRATRRPFRCPEVRLHPAAAGRAGPRTDGPRCEVLRRCCSCSGRDPSSTRGAGTQSPKVAAQFHSAHVPYRKNGRAASASPLKAP